MSQYLELIWDKMEEDPKQKETIQTVVEACFQAEQLEDKKLVLSITLTIPEEIRKLNKQYRNIDQETDVLSFPMFEKQELEERSSSRRSIRRYYHFHSKSRTAGKRIWS